MAWSFKIWNLLIWHSWPSKDGTCYNIIILFFHVVFKVKYFPHCDFLSSNLGSNPSYVWHSIYEAKFVVQSDYLWRIVRGDHIHIWSDNWLPNSPTRKVITGCNSLAVDACVNELIDTSHSGRWITALVKQVFLPCEAS